MTKQYVIQWKSKSNGRAGRGTKKFEEQDAMELVAELNADYPDIEHEAVPDDSGELPPVVAATPETSMPAEAPSTSTEPATSNANELASASEPVPGEPAPAEPEAVPTASPQVLSPTE